MSSTGEPQPKAETRKSPPPLPARLADPWPVVVAGTALWFLLFGVLAVARYGFHADPGPWLGTALAGWVLGLIGLGIMTWQRAAARRGNKSAQRGL